MSSLGALPAAAPPTGQLVAPAGGVRLAELVVGQLYRVTVTGSFPGKAEILIGNQYLLAATAFRFQPGDVITLKLAACTAELLQFQLALAPAVDLEAVSGDLATLLRAAALPDTAQNRTSLALLLQAGAPVTNATLADISQLLAALPQAAVAAFLPQYKQLLERNLKLDQALLRQLARLEASAPGRPEIAALLAGALAQAQRERERGGQRRQAQEETLRAALAAESGEIPGDGALSIEQRIGMLYGSPERAMGTAILRQAENAARGGATAEELKLTDLDNLLGDEEQVAGLEEALALLQALRIVNALVPQGLNIALPTLIEGEPTDVQLSSRLLAEQYYHKDYALRIRVSNATQGQVEFQLRTRGPGLFIDVMAGDERTRAAYGAELERLREELSADGAYIVRKLEVSRQSL